MTRVEAWRYFHPFNNGGAEPDYTFVGNRSSLGVAYAGPRWSLQGTLQYVRLENLPARAIGPGLMGTGARTTSRPPARSATSSTCAA